MGETSAIEWTDATWNPIRGCTRVSEGCRHCYAETLAARFSEPGQWGHGLAERTSKGARWTGRIDVAADATFLAPLRWKRPRRIFVNSLSDLFHEGVPDAVIDRVFAVMALSPQHTFQLLTKRPERMREYLLSSGPDGEPREMRWMWESAERGWRDELVRAPSSPLPNVWLGVSVEDQAAADARIPLLLATPAAKRFLSCEPLLGAVDLKFIRSLNRGAFDCTRPVDRRYQNPPEILPAIDWVIAGGESGPGARSMHPDWARQLRDQCAAADVPFFFKQWGEWLPIKDRDQHGFNGWAMIDHLPQQDGMFRAGKKRAGNLLDGRQHLEWPDA